MFGVHLLEESPAPEFVTALRKQLNSRVHLSVGLSPEAPQSVRVLVSGWPSESLLDELVHLEALVIPFSGLPVSTAQRVRGRGLQVFNLHHNAPAVTELALSLLFSAAKCIVPMDRTLRTFDWRPRYGTDPGVMLSGRRALVLGYGAIGQRIATALSALGLQVRVIRRTNPDPTAPIPILSPDALDDALQAADVLMIALPGTPATEGLLDRRRLARLPQDAIVVNVGRARILDERALYDALHEGALHSAGLDVWYQYPKGVEGRQGTPPATAPFHTLDNVVMSPHRAGHGADSERLRGEHLARTLNALQAGERPPNQVSLDEGY